MTKNISRKDFLKYATLTAAGLPLALSAVAIPRDLSNLSAKNKKITISIFSKNLQWLNFQEMAKLAAKMGFDGIDLTVRANGHINPARVAQELPIAVKTIRKEGLDVFTITTDIKTVDETNTESILKTAAQLGIKNYRMNWYAYDNDVDPLVSLEDIKKRMANLAALNERYQIHGDYQNHTGLFGSSLWDLWLVLKDLDPKWIGCQFDVRHATVDSAKSWPTALKLLLPYIGSLPIKDFLWVKDNGEWRVKNMPLGEGMVDFNLYFKLLKKHNLAKPFSLHYEYDLGGADNGATKLSIPQIEVTNKMEADLQKLKSWLIEYEIS